MSNHYARALIVVTGRVHGVGFRYYVYHIAQRYKLNGYVKNVPDERVKIDAEGAYGMLTELIKDVKHGPETAYVSHVDVAWKEYASLYSSFSIEF